MEYRKNFLETDLFNFQDEVNENTSLVSSPTDDNTGVDSDGDREMCPCRMPVTEDDYKKISDGMPPRMSGHILTECLGISDAWYPELEENRYNDLMTWSNRQTSEVTRAILYDKLAKALHMEICESSDWFDFLIPVQCKNHYSSIVEMQNICTTDDCPCSMEVSERDYSKISRGMPPRMWKHICRECLGISDADLYKAEYKNWFQSIESSICDALITWSHAQEVGVTKARLYGKFVKARKLGLCETTEWFDFLIPNDCRCRVPSFGTEIRRPERTKPGILEECRVRLLSNPLGIHILLTSFMVQLLYGIKFRDEMGTGILLLNSFLRLITLVNVCLACSGFVQIASPFVIDLKSKIRIVFLLSGVIHSITLLTIENYVVSYVLNIVLIQIPLLFVGAEIIPTFFVTKQQITAVYGMYRPQRFFHEKILSFINWSVCGVMTACFVQLNFDLNSTSVFYISLFTAIAIVFVWFSTLDRDSPDFYQQLISLFLLISKFCSIDKILVLLGSIAGAIGLIVIYVLLILHYEHHFVIRENTDLLKDCICTLVILNIQRIFYFNAEGKRQFIVEVYVVVGVYILNMIIMYIRLSDKCNYKRLSEGDDVFGLTLFQASKFFSRFLFPMNGYSPYYEHVCPGPVVYQTVRPLNTIAVPFNQTVLSPNTTDIPLNVTNLTFT